jgi:hypothetical protein
VTAASAVFRAQGRTDSTPAHYFFQYSVNPNALGTGFGQQTPTRGPIPAGIQTTGGGLVPFSEQVVNLRPARTYYYRVCGGDGQTSGDVCAQVRSFTTPALSPGCSESGQTVTCTYTSGSNAFAVPPGVSSIHVVAVGGKGGVDRFFFQGAGPGAVVSGDLSVAPGSTLFAVVATNANQITPGDTPGGAGGGNGGHSGEAAGAGGGSSDVRTSQNDLSSRLLVAGGGGGAGGDSRVCLNGCLSITRSGGGAGGAGGQDGSPATCGGRAGGAPTAQGGDGASGAPINDPNAFGFSGGGGGGGGGLLGGAGGGGSSTAGGCGGGGGSNLVPPGGSQAIDTTGNPMVQISYQLPT